MPKTFIISWHMDGTFETRAETEEEIHALMKTLNRQELVFKCRTFDYDVEEIDTGSAESAR